MSIAPARNRSRRTDKADAATPMPDNHGTETETDEVACDGGGGSAGHPKVFLNLGADGRVDCPYCGHRFTRKGGPSGADAKS